ncbi:MAG: hypothetical protein ABSA12_10100 [Verrucomicrobiia bacterium]|jgi:hypothetical protein
MKTSSTNRAFNLCFLLAFGLAFWPVAGRSQTPISCGQTIASNTVTISEIDQYSYVGTAGQVISVSLAASVPNCNYGVAADVYSPVGKLLATASANCYGGGAVNLTCTNSGTYTILVHSSSYNATTGYSLGVQQVNIGGCDTRAISCGQTVASNTTLHAEMDAYSYAGTSGQVISVSLAASVPNCNYSVAADIYNPGGQLLGTAPANCYGGGAVNLTCTNSGAYTILVHSSSYSATTSYSLDLQTATGGGCNTTPIACGQGVSTNISQQAEIDAYLISGCSGESVLISAGGFSGSQFDFYDPTGNLLFSIGSGTATNITFSSSGNYTLLVHASNYGGTGSYSVSLTCIIGECYATISTTSSPLVGGWTSGGGTFTCCSAVTVCATPESCYNFTNWTLNGTVVSTSPCYTFTSSSSETLTANFAPTAGVTNQICGIQTAGTNVAISVQSVAGDNYQLQSRNSMTAGSWANISGVVLSNSPGGLIILTNIGGASAPQKFYRVGITP